MVLYFKCIDPEYVVYMGKDKFENEELIRYAWPEDVWFHVDEVSSAHVYLRLKKGQTLEDIPPLVLEDCAQLVKANSIQGSKLPSVAVIYTFASNLKKAVGMDIGQVGFHNQKAVRTIKSVKKMNEIINRLNKTKEELTPDLAAMLEQRNDEERKEKKKDIIAKKQAEAEAKEAMKKQIELKHYTNVMVSENMKSNKSNPDANIEEDFM